MKHPLVAKALALVGVLMALMFGLDTISRLVSEREERLREAERGVANALATAQTLVGPVLQRRCVELREVEQGEGKDRRLVTERRELSVRAVPKTLDLQAESTTEARYRGIFKVHAYTVKASAATTWDPAAVLRPAASHADARLVCEPTVVAVAVGDTRGIRSATLRVDGTVVDVRPGTQLKAHPQGFHAVLPATLGERGPTRIELSLDLVGTGGLSFVPAAERSDVALRSDWAHPSFEGRFLPVERAVDDQGFKATWRLTALATTAADELRRGSAMCGMPPLTLSASEAPTAAASDADPTRCVERFGVGFIDPVSAYRLSDRATKYGVLFIALTFLGVGLVEVMRQRRVHPVQYLLVGSALVVFFLLLLSLTEHLPFAWAYGLASAACTALLGFYGCFLLGSVRAGTAFAAGIALLYGALYLLLQLEQNALLLGALLVFAALAATMVATRRIDWHALTEGLARPAGRDATPAG